MSDLLNLFAHRDKVARAKAELGRASLALTNAQISERLAEIKSQHEPLFSLIGMEDILDPAYQTVRKKLYAAAFYVVVGRMPEIPEQEQENES